MVKVGLFAKALPSLGGNRALVDSAGELLVHFTVPFIVMTAFALGMYVWVDDALHYRCVPTDFTSSNVLDNEYYSIYGYKFFWTPYNNAYCGATYVSLFASSVTRLLLIILQPSQTGLVTKASPVNVQMTVSVASWATSRRPGEPS